MNMETLPKFYKRYVYTEGLDDGEHGKNCIGTLYWNDEMDIYICDEYYGLYGEFSKEDEKFLEALGFVVEDFTMRD